MIFLMKRWKDICKKRYASTLSRARVTDVGETNAGDAPEARTEQA